MDLRSRQSSHTKLPTCWNLLPVSALLAGLPIRAPPRFFYGWTMETWSRWQMSAKDREQGSEPGSRNRSASRPWVLGNQSGQHRPWPAPRSGRTASQGFDVTQKTPNKLEGLRDRKGQSSKPLITQTGYPGGWGQGPHGDKPTGQQGNTRLGGGGRGQTPHSSK